MSEIISNVEQIHSSDETIYTFLSNLNNFKELMPDQIENWQSTEDTCSFRIKNMADLSLRLTEKVPHSLIVLSPEGKAPFSFSLRCILQKVDENKTNATIMFKADLNAMMEMLAKSPLQNFVNILVAKLKQKFDQKI
jgi:carbon monoxide dehydrogenase subunit G